MIEDIIRSIRRGKFRITDHADEEAQNDGLTLEEIMTATINGEIIERYPEDQPYPSCLIFGRTMRNAPLHSVWAYHEAAQASILVTVYRPNPAEWIDWKKRRTP